jgi:hypothetical protein
MTLMTRPSESYLENSMYRGLSQISVTICHLSPDLFKPVYLSNIGGCVVFLSLIT